MSHKQLLDEFAAAEHIGMSVAFLRSARSRGILGNRTPPPPHMQLGRSVRYDRADLDTWLNARRVDPAARRAVSRNAA
jgi:hypothetical protein